MPDLIDTVAAYCQRHDLIRPRSTIVVAMSGGPDSLCLLHLLQHLAPRWQLRLHVAHLDHQLRPESADDARFVVEIAAAWQLPITTDQIDVARAARNSRRGIEETARTIRYQFLGRVADQIGARAIALGHNADDQAETVLLRLLRGAGPSGLAAMRPKRAIAEGRAIDLIRPLLDTPRSAIAAYCVQHNLQPRSDPSNQEPIYLRNRVRGYILPLLKPYNENIVATLGRTARICAEEADLIDQLAMEAWDELVTIDQTGVIVDRARFDRLHPAVQRRIVRRAAHELIADVELEARHVDLLLAAIGANRRRVQLPRGVWATIRQQVIRFTIEPTV